jgi:hypothetical protein
MRQQTWFATVVCTIAVLPGFIVGALAKAFLYIFGGWAEGSDFLYLRAPDSPSLALQFAEPVALPF